MLLAYFPHHSNNNLLTDALEWIEFQSFMAVPIIKIKHEIKILVNVLWGDSMLAGSNNILGVAV